MGGGEPRPLRAAVRSFVRDSLLVVSSVLTAPLWGLALVASAIGLGDDSFLSCGQFLSLFPGSPGVYLRRAFYVICLEGCARDCDIGFATWFAHRKARVGRSVYIGARCTLGLCDIGDYVLIGSNVDVLSGRFQHLPGDPEMRRQGEGGRLDRVHIGNDAWIGNGSVIMADVGEGAVIGAGSVVVKPIPPRSVAVGNPAAVRKHLAETVANEDGR